MFPEPNTYNILMKNTAVDKYAELSVATNFVCYFGREHLEFTSLLLTIYTNRPTYLILLIKFLKSP